MGIVTEKLLFGHGTWTSPKDIQLDIRVHSSNQTWIKHGSNMACWKTFYFSFSDLFPSEAPSTSGISTKSRAAIDDTVCFGSLISHFHPLSWYILISETIYKTFIFPYHPWSKFDIFHDYHPSKATFFTLSLSPMKKTSIFLWFSYGFPIQNLHFRWDLPNRIHPKLRGGQVARKAKTAPKGAQWDTGRGQKSHHLWHVEYLSIHIHIHIYILQ